MQQAGGLVEPVPLTVADQQPVLRGVLNDQMVGQCGYKPAVALIEKRVIAAALGHQLQLVADLRDKAAVVVRPAAAQVGTQHARLRGMIGTLEGQAIGRIIDDGIALIAGQRIARITDAVLAVLVAFRGRPTAVHHAR